MNKGILIPVIASILILGVIGLEQDVMAEIVDVKRISQPSPQFSDFFGHSVATGDVDNDGNVDLIVGAPSARPGGVLGSGEAFVFFGPDYTTVITLTEPTPEPRANFGISVATGDVNNDGNDDVIVGAGSADGGGLNRAGEAFVFLGPSLTTVIPLTEPTPEASATFGSAVTTGDVNNDGNDDVIVGAPVATASGQPAAGEVFVFLGPSLTTTISLTEPTIEFAARFGFSVASGDVNNDGNDDVIVGALNADSGGLTNSGEAFVFLGPSLTTVTTLSEPTPQANVNFGYSVTSGDINNDGNDDVIVGAHRATGSGQPAAGEVFVFLGPSLTTVIPLTEPISIISSQFGFSVATGDVNNDGNDDVLVGANMAPHSNEFNVGEAFIFLGPFLTTAIPITEPTHQSQAQFGISTVLDDLNNDGNDDVIVGTGFSDAGGLNNAGEVFLFLSPEFPTVLALSEPISEANAQFGTSVSFGDINNDGNDDVIVGSPRSKVGGTAAAGEVFVFSTISFTPVTTLTEPTPEINANFGHSVATGDINNDGNDDVIVGAFSATIGSLSNAGEVFVLLGPLFTTVIPLTEPTAEAGAQFGISVTSGDINNDGNDDVIVGAGSADGGGLNNAGEAFVFLGPSLTTVIPLTEPTPELSAFFGVSVSSGDVNNDGNDDVIVGAVGARPGGVLGSGEAFVFLGPSLTTVTTLTEPIPEANANFGFSVASGDVNNDGNDDVIVGAENADGGGLNNAGEAFVFLGPSLTTVTTLTEPTPEATATFGHSVSTGDINNDGNDDVIVGAHRATVSGQQAAGEAFVFLGPSLTTVLTINDPVSEVGAAFGNSVATGDINNDGNDDVIVGEFGSDKRELNGSITSNAGKIIYFRGIKVPMDTIPPVITLLGSDPIVLQVGDSYVEPGATVTDNSGEDLSGALVIDSSSVDSSQSGTYIVTYDVTDSSGNQAVQVTRTVEVFTTVITTNIGTNLNLNPGDTILVSNGAVVSGNIQANGGDVIITEGSVVTGNIEGSNGASIVIEGGSTVNGNIEIVVSGPGSTLEIIDSDVGGNIETNNIDTLTITGSNLNGNILSDSDGTVTITDNPIINGNLEIISPSISCTESDNNINGNNSGCP